MSCKQVIVLFCNKTTILMKFERKLGMRRVYRIHLHGYAKEELCTRKV